jgi:hypothetical protein
VTPRTHGVAGLHLLTPCPSDPSLAGGADEVLDDAIKVVSSQLDAPAVWPHDNERGVGHHLLACRGPRCNAAGAADLHARLKDKLAHALDTEILVTVTAALQRGPRHASRWCLKGGNSCQAGLRSGASDPVTVGVARMGLCRCPGCAG